MVGFVAAGEEPFSVGSSILYGIIGAGAVNYAIGGIAAFNTAKEKKDDFENRWREYRRVD